MSVPEPIGPFGEMLSDAEREQFVARARRAHYDRGEVLFREDDVTRHALLIESGSVKIVRRRPDGADLILAVRGGNDLIGEMAAIDGTPRSASAVAMGPVDAHLIDADAFESFIRANDNVAWMLIRSMAERQRDTDQRRLDQASASVAHRVAAAVLDMADREVARDDDEGFIVSQAELAEIVGATREAVAKALADLRRVGAVETSRRRLRIVDRARLVECMRN
nr:Crp/Fnr family transcriptional regulator [uncultured Actinoplanes sp.]